MRNLNQAILHLEEEINRQRCMARITYRRTKTLFSKKVAAPSTLLIAFITGGMLGRSIKRQLKPLPATQQRPGNVKKRRLDKLLIISSEISAVLGFFNTLKKALNALRPAKSSPISAPQKTR